jgi:hypothetical protein
MLYLLHTLMKEIQEWAENAAGRHGRLLIAAIS